MNQSNVPFVSVIAFAVIATSSAQAATNQKSNINVTEVHASISQHIEMNMRELETTSKTHLNELNAAVKTEIQTLNKEKAQRFANNTLTTNAVSE